MPGMLIGYARVSTEEQDLTRAAELAGSPGRRTSRAYVDHLAQSGLVPVSHPMSVYDPERPGLPAAVQTSMSRQRHPKRHAEPRHSVNRPAGRAAGLTAPITVPYALHGRAILGVPMASG